MQAKEDLFKIIQDQQSKLTNLIDDELLYINERNLEVPKEIRMNIVQMRDRELNFVENYHLVFHTNRTTSTTDVE